MKFDKKILLASLENAIKHDGKANVNAVLGIVLSKNLELKKNIKELQKNVSDVVSNINNVTLEEQKLQFKNLGGEITEKKEEERKLPELKNVKGKIIMRLAPYPSGPLHIGNSRPYIINDEYVKMYNGKLLLVIDDTIGSEAKAIVKDAYKLIPEGLEWLDIAFDKKVIYKSDRLEIYYKYAEELIKKNKAYVCECSSEILRGNRQKGLECNCRVKSISTNLRDWEKMFKAKEGSTSLRIKTDMKHKNPAFRDRVIFRISDRKHPRIGNKFRIWPLLDFSWAIDDHLLDITHILRGKELMMESDMERYIWNVFKWRQIEIIHTGLLQIEGIKLSKSKSKKEVESGAYEGWDDPRTWSLQSLKRRGFQPEAIRRFILSFGVTQSEIKVPVDVLYSENRKLLDKKVNRYFFISNPKKIKIKNAPNLNVEVPLHPDDNRGHRKFKTEDEFYISDDIKKNTVYRFMHLFNFKDNKYLSTELDKSLNAKLIHWIPANDNFVNVEIVMVDNSRINGIAESSVRNLKVDDIIQFERQFFCRLDNKSNDKIVFSYAHN